MEIYIMFKFIKDKVDEISRLKQENRALVEEKYVLEINLQNLKIQNDELLKIKEKTSDAESVFDFKSVRAFSVERLEKDGYPCTIIGYLLNEPVFSNDGSVVANKDVVHQWYLYCSTQRHEEIIRDYKKALK